MITIDSVDPLPLATWWAAGLGGEVVAENEGWFAVVAVPGWPHRLAFQKVDQVSPGKNRIHLDLVTDDVPATLTAWRKLGADDVATHEMDGFGWTVLADPQGNQFCVAASE